MPPRSARKAATKKPSPMVKEGTPPPSNPSPSVVAEKTDLAAEIPLAAVPAAVKEEVVVAEEDVAPSAAVEVEKVPKLEVEEETAAETIGEEEALENVGQEETVERVGEETASEKVGKEAAAEKVQDSVEPPLEAAEGNEGKEADNQENEMDVEEEGDEQIVEEETGEGEIENISGGGADGVGNVADADGLSDDDNVRDGDAYSEENEEDDPTLYMQAPLTERKRQKEFEIFIGGLDKGAVEEDLFEVFGVYGEIQSVRIVKHPLTQKSKGFAFIRYASIEHAKKALAELKDGIEIKGKQIRVSASQDNDTLYLGNICKSWTRDNVIETLKHYGVEQIEHIVLPDDPKNEGKIKGFAFLEFSSHSEAMAAFQRLRKPDALFGRDISAKVAFAQTPLRPSEEALLQVKTVYVEGIPKSWDEARVKELCKQYGEIERIHLSRNSTSTKRKDFGFVDFTSRDSAAACVEGINNAQLGEEDVNVKANFAKPMNKGRLAKQSARGGFKVKKDGEATEEAGQSKKKKKKAKSKVVNDKEETQSKSKSSNWSKPSKSQNKDSKGRKDPQTAQSAKGKKRGRRGMDTITNEEPSKKARNNRNYGKVRGRPSTGYGNQRNSYSSVPYVPRQAAYAPRYAPPATNYMTHAYAGTSGSQHRRSDLEPHAGYLPAAKQVRNPYGYELRRAGAYDSQPRSSSGYAGAPAVQPSYPGYSSYAGNEAGYAYPSGGAYAYRGAYY